LIALHNDVQKKEKIMKLNHIMKKIVPVFSIVLLTLFSCSSDDNDNPAVSQTPASSDQTIVDIAVADGRFTTLVAALGAAGLVETLQDDGPFTVFAPTDDAFAALPAGTVDALLEPANKSQLTEILTYHVFSGDVMASDAVALAGSSVSMLNGIEMRIDVDNGQVVLNQNGNRKATVIITDIVASNGVIHVIDAVLDPDDGRKNIVETAMAAGNFTTLVAALQAAELDDALAGTVPFTVFAPTDDAFALLPAGTIDTLLDPANKDTLINILTYHVIAGKVLAADAIALDGSSATMLNKDEMMIDVVSGSVVLNLGGNRQATVTKTDIRCSNGVIHVIDAVLDPADSP